MTNKQDLYNVLFKHKTELSRQRIELSLIDDIKKIYGSAGGKFLSLESDLFDVKKKMLELMKVIMNKEESDVHEYIKLFKKEFRVLSSSSRRRVVPCKKFLGL
jgi:hypothetical protein